MCYGIIVESVASTEDSRSVTPAALVVPDSGHVSPSSGQVSDGGHVPPAVISCVVMSTYSFGNVSDRGMLFT